MKRVFIYRIADIPLRKDIERFLSDDYEITGYVDYNYSEDVVYGKPFVPAEKLRFEEFEYIILAVRREKSQAEIRETLIKYGIPEDKILIPTSLLRLEKEGNQLDLVAELDRCFGDEEGVIFGLSYSLRGILKNKMNRRCFDFSWHGLDLYYNFRLFEYALNKGFFPKAKTALLVFPYYYFNYDASRSLYQYVNGQMFAVRGLGDWHNAGKLVEADNYIANYQLFGDKISQYFCFERFQFQTVRSYSKSNGRLSNIWFAEHTATIEENRILFSEFVRLLRRCGLKVCVVVPPVNIAMIDSESKKVYERKKQDFYAVIKACDTENDITVLDCAEIFSLHPELFYDLHHINCDGAEVLLNTLMTAFFRTQRMT